MNVLTPVDLTGSDAAPADPRARGESTIRIDVHSDIGGLATEWRAFERRAAGSFYQSFAWCSAWLDTAGREHGAATRIVTGRDGSGRLLFLLPLSVRRRWGCRVLEWIGSAQIGYGYGIYDLNFLFQASAWFAAEGWRIFEAVGPIDAANLERMPQELHAAPHPLSSWFSLHDANRTYILSLGARFNALHARKRSAETRRGNRKRDAKLAAWGELSFGLPSTRAETHALLDVMFEQQQSRLEEAGILRRFSDSERRFIHRLAGLAGDAGPALLPYRLKIGDEIAAVMLGGYHGNIYWALISALANAPYRRHSPGDAALRRLIEACCERGLAAIDFGTGDASYKDHWADRTVDLHASVRAVTARGYAWALMAIGAGAAKRAIKTTPALWAAATFLRRRLAVRR